MDFFLLSISLLLSIVSIATEYVAHADCNSENVEKCATGVQTMYEMQEIMIHNNPEEIRVLCSHTQEAMDCINLYVIRCLDENHRTLYRDLTGGLQNFIQEFCDENSEFSLEYRRHLQCYNNLTTEFQDCAMYVTKVDEQVVYNKLEAKKAAKFICCMYDESINCYRRITLNHCAQEAADFLDTIFHKLLANVTRLLKCEEYTYDEQSCRALAASAAAGKGGPNNLRKYSKGKYTGSASFIVISPVPLILSFLLLFFLLPLSSSLNT